jgi:hypothetical protein
MVVCALALARWLRRRSRGFTAFAALEIVLVPAVALITINERLYGALTPYAAVLGEPTGATGIAEHVARAPRLVGALLDPEVGLLVWAPAGALAFLALELLARSLRERLHVALPSVVDVEVSAAFLAILCAVQLGRGGVPRPVADRGGLPRPRARPRPARRRRAVGVGPAPCAAHRRRARRGDARGEPLAARRRARRRRRVARPARGRAAVGGPRARRRRGRRRDDRLPARSELLRERELR